MNLVVLAVLGVYLGISMIALSALPVTAIPGHPHHFQTLLGVEGHGGFQNDPVLGIVSRLGLHGTVLTIAQYYVGLLAATILFIATNAGMIGISRLSWSLSEHRQLPGIFSQLHVRFRTPWFTILFFSGLAGILVLYGNTNVLGNLYSFGALLSFTIAHISVIALRVKEPDRERPYRLPWNVRIRGASIPMTAVIGGIGTATVWVVVVITHPEARVVGIPWMMLGMVGYIVYRRRQGLDLRRAITSRAPSAQPTSRRLAIARRWCRSSAGDVSASALSSAAKLIGEEGVVYAVFVLPVPSQLSLEAGLEAEEAEGRAALESARIKARRSNIKIRTG